jgi:cobalt/nickel transport system permease protein
MVMHIPDGFLDGPVAAAAAVPAIAAVGYGVRRAGRTLDDRQVPLLGVTAAFIFAVQMLNFPVAGGTSGHLLGGALAAVLLGPWLACIVMAVVISGQAFVFADGGVTALGANILNMGVIGALGIGLLMTLARRVLPANRTVFLSVAGAGAWASVMLGALMCSLELGASGTVPLSTVLPAMLGVHALIGIGEAVITVTALSAVLATRPDLIDGAGFGAIAPAEAIAPAGVAS